MVPKEEPGSERIDPMHLNQAEREVNLDTGEMWENGRAVAGNGLYPRPRGVGPLMTRQAPGVGNYLHPLSHHVVRHQKKTEAPQTAFRDAMEVTWCPPMTWEDRVQEEEEEHERHSSTRGDSLPNPSSPPLEGCNVSDISMAEEGPQQRDSDMIVEEEREESMEMDAPLDSATPTPLKEKVISEGLKAEVEEDRCSQTSEESTDQNLPHDLDPDEDELLGLPADISVPGGHSDDSIALVVSPGDDDLWMCYLCLEVNDNNHDTHVEANGIGFIWTHISSLV